MTPNIMGGEKMSSWDKLLKRFLELDHDIRFEEIVKVMKEYGYEIKQPKGGSSHYSFVKPGCSRIVIPRHKPIKKVYVKMIKKVIEEEMKEDESKTQLLHESIVWKLLKIKMKEDMSYLIRIFLDV